MRDVEVSAFKITDDNGEAFIIGGQVNLNRGGRGERREGGGDGRERRKGRGGKCNLTFKTRKRREQKGLQVRIQQQPKVTNP